MTNYRVLRLYNDEKFLLLAESVEAHGPQQAIRAVAKDMVPDKELEAGVVLVAVPVSNWTQEPVGIVQPPPRLIVGSDEIPGQVTLEDALASEPPVDPPAGGSEAEEETS